MRIFVSSSFEDLREHRAAAIRVLRQLGHEVLAMEDMVAGTAAPLAKVIELVDRSEAYVGIFAWRYGYVPGVGATPPPNSPVPAVAGASYGRTSITHYEYLRAVERGLPIMAFLLDERCPWPPHAIDGFDLARTDAPADASAIRELRQTLQQERVVSWFTTPEDLEARVSAAVTTAGLSRQLDLRAAPELGPIGVASDSAADIGITQAILDTERKQPALKIDLNTTWWSTRLYLVASLAERLTDARRILVVHTKPATRNPTVGAAPDPANTAPHTDEEQFVGQLPTSAILNIIGAKVPALGRFAKALKRRSADYSNLAAEIADILDLWRATFNDPPGTHVHEQAAKVEITADLLRRWFGDSMLTHPLKIADLERASAVDLLRLLDYPSDYVPVRTRRTKDGEAAHERVETIDKVALNERLARAYMVELLDRARIS